MSPATKLPLSVLSLTIASAVWAAPGPSVLLKPSTNLVDEPRENLVITFEPDAARCARDFGRDWRNTCRARIGSVVEQVRNISMTPEVKGHWRWEDENRLVFQPEGYWPKQTRFTVNLEGLPRAPGVGLTEPKITFMTPPLLVNDATETFWHGPRLNGERELTITLSLSTQVANPEAFERSMTIAEKTPTGLEWDKPRFIWNADGTEVYIRIPMRKLGKTPGELVVGFPKLAQAITDDPAGPVAKTGFESAVYHIPVPGESTLYQVESASVRPVRDADLDRLFSLEFKTSLLTNPGELARAVQIWELPAKLTPEAVEKADWSLTPYVDESVLARSKRITPELKGDPSVPSERAELTFNATPGSYLYVELPAGFGPGSGYTLEKKWGAVIPAPDPSAQVRFLQPGHMLTLSGANGLTLAVNGGERLAWTVSRYRRPFLALAADQYDALGREDPTDNYAVARTGSMELPADDAHGADTRFVTLPLADKDASPEGGLYQIEVRLEKKNESGGWNTVDRQVKKVLVTDFATIAKTTRSKGLDVFVADLASTRPVAKARVDVLGANGLSVATATTDDAGHAHFDSLKGFEREKAPVAVVVDRGDGRDLGWLSLVDARTTNDDFRFNTRGRDATDAGVVGMLFTGRALYRPGETVHVGGFIKEASLKPLTDKTPVLVTIRDNLGAELLKKTLEPGPSGAVTLDWTSPAEGALDNVSIELWSGDALLATKNISVRDFDPETMLLASRLIEPAKGWQAPGSVSVEARLIENVGVPGAGRVVEASVGLSPVSSITFPERPGYRFLAEADRPYVKPVELNPATTDKNGTVRFTLPGSLATAGLSRAYLNLTGMSAEGSSAVSETLEFLVGAPEKLLGYELPETAAPLNYLPAAKPLAWRFLVVDRSLKGVEGEEVTAVLSKRHYETELYADARGELHYRETPTTAEAESFKLKTDAEGTASLTLPLVPAGEYVLSFKGADGTDLGRVDFTLVGEDLRTGLENRLPAAHMHMNLEKTEVDAGGVLNASVLSPFKGFALLTLEAEDVLAHEWVPVEEGMNAVSIRVPEGHTGRAWMNASLVRAPSEAHRFLEAYTFALEPVALSVAPHRMTLGIESPAKIRSGEKARITITSDAPGDVFVWAVDEGILSNTNYRTPRPIEELLLDRALGVRTHQSLSELMPEGFKLPKATLVGGDSVRAAMMKEFAANPFHRQNDASAAWWGGLVKVDPEHPATLDVELPATFKGRVRIMAVGSGATKLGNAEKAMTVSTPVMPFIDVPDFVSPGDEFLAYPSVLAEESFRGTLGVKSGAGFTITPSDAVNVTLKPFDESRYEVHFKADGLAGPVEGEVTADGTVGTKDGPAAYRTSAPWHGAVRPATQKIAFTRWGSGAGVSLTVGPLEAMLPGDVKTELTLSRHPVSLIAPMMDALAYRTAWEPEARIATALAALRLEYGTGLGFLIAPTEKGRHEAVDLAVASGVATLRRFMQYDGVTIYGETDPVTNAMAIELMTRLNELKHDGADLELARNLVAAAGRVRAESLPLDDIGAARAYAYLLMAQTKAGVMTADRLEELEDLLDKRARGWRTDIVAAMMAEAYEHLYLPEPAGKLRAGVAWNALDLTPMPRRQGRLSTMEALSTLPKLISGNTRLMTRYTTALIRTKTTDLSSRMIGMGVLGLAVREDGRTRPLTGEVACRRWAPGMKPDSVTEEYGATRLVHMNGCLEFEISKTDPSAPLFWAVTNEGYEASPEKGAVDQGVLVEKKLVDSTGETVKSVRVGDVVTMKVTFKATGPVSAEYALSDLLPGGFTWGERKSFGQSVHQPRTDADRMSAIVEPGTWSYTIRATHAGRFTIPSAMILDLYDPVHLGRSALGTIEVLPLEKPAK